MPPLEKHETLVAATDSILILTPLLRRGIFLSCLDTTLPLSVSLNDFTLDSEAAIGAPGPRGYGQVPPSFIAIFLVQSSFSPLP